MQSFGILLKSNSSELAKTKRCVESALRFATEPIPIFVIVPESEVPEFWQVFGESIVLLSETLWEDHLVHLPNSGNESQDLYQKILRLAFAEKCFVENYLCLGPEVVFLRPYCSRDFLDPQGFPYSFLSESRELQTDPTATHYWAQQEDFHHALKQFFGLDEGPYLTSRNIAVMNTEQVQGLLNFIGQNGQSIGDALDLCQDEFSWYDFWVERESPNSRIVRDPIVKVVQTEGEYQSLELRSVSQQDLSRGYIALSADLTRISIQAHSDSALAKFIGTHIDYRTLLGAIFERCFSRAPRVRALLGKRSRPNFS